MHIIFDRILEEGWIFIYKLILGIGYYLAIFIYHKKNIMES